MREALERAGRALPPHRRRHAAAVAAVAAAAAGRKHGDQGLDGAGGAEGVLVRRRAVQINNGQIMAQ